MTKEESWIPSHEELGGGFLGVIDRVVCWIVAIGLLGISAILMIQVLARYLVNSPTVWSEELAISLFVWVAMLAIPLGFRRGEHLTLDILSKRLNPVANRVLAIVIAVLTVLTLLVIGYFAAKLAPAADRQVLAGIAGGLGIPAKVSWVYWAVPVGSFLSIVFTIERVALMLRGKVTVLNADADATFIENLEDDVSAEEQLESSIVPSLHDSAHDPASLPPAEREKRQPNDNEKDK
ncbi:MAG: TRAP transporter small permease [Mycetocola sp.]